MVLGPVHTKTFSCVFVLFTVLKGIENNQHMTWNNKNTQENVSVCTWPKCMLSTRNNQRNDLWAHCPMTTRVIYDTKWKEEGLTDILPASCLTYVPTSSKSRKINYSRTTITRTTITVGKWLLNDKNPSRESRNVVILKSIKVLGLSS